MTLPSPDDNGSSTPPGHKPNHGLGGQMDLASLSIWRDGVLQPIAMHMHTWSKFQAVLILLSCCHSDPDVCHCRQYI